MARSIASFASIPSFHQTRGPNFIDQKRMKLLRNQEVGLMSHYLGESEEDIWINEVDRDARRDVQGDTMGLEMKVRY